MLALRLAAAIAATPAPVVAHQVWTNDMYHPCSSWDRVHDTARELLDGPRFDGSVWEVTHITPGSITLRKVRTYIAYTMVDILTLTFIA